MRILYGVAGQGSGHATRARAVIEHLLREGHDIHVVAHDASWELLHRDVPTTRVTGLTLAYADNRVRYMRTAFANALRAPGNAKSIARVRRKIEAWNPAVVLSDFEPITGAVALFARRPLISVDNIHALTRTDIAIPKGPLQKSCPRQRRDVRASTPPQNRRKSSALSRFEKACAAEQHDAGTAQDLLQRSPQRYTVEARMARAVTRLVNAGAAAYVITTFAPLTATKPRTHLVPPLLRDAVLHTQPRAGEHVLVYSTSAHREILALLGEIRAPFIVYGIPDGRTRGNVMCKRPSAPGFLRDLAACRAVIATAGFTLMTEALHLGKPMLALPVAHQFEQTANGLLLIALGYGAMCESLTRERIATFLTHTDQYAKRLRAYPRQDNTEAFRTIDRLIAIYG